MNKLSEDQIAKLSDDLRSTIKNEVERYKEHYHSFFNLHYGERGIDGVKFDGSFTPMELYTFEKIAIMNMKVEQEGIKIQNNVKRTLNEFIEKINMLVGEEEK